MYELFKCKCYPCLGTWGARAADAMRMSMTEMRGGALANVIVRSVFSSKQLLINTRFL